MLDWRPYRHSRIYNFYSSMSSVIYINCRRDECPNLPTVFLLLNVSPRAPAFLVTACWLEKKVHGCSIFPKFNLHFILVGRQGFGLSKRMPSFPPSSDPCARQGSQQQPAMLLKNSSHGSETPVLLWHISHHKFCMDFRHN